MKKEGDVLLHMEVSGDDFNLGMEGRSHDFIAALLYACRQEPALIKVFKSVVRVWDDYEFQAKSNEFFNTQGDA